MTFPNGYRGVKKIFTAEILSLISGVLLIAAGISGIASVAALASAEGDVALVSLGGAGIFSIIALILVIIASILRLVGLNQAGKDENLFRTAFLISIFVLVMAIVAAILTAIFGSNSVIDDIVTLLQRLASVAVIFLVVSGIQTFAEKLNHEKLAKKGNSIIWIIAIPYILSAIAGLVQGLFGSNETTGNISAVITLIGGILTVVGSILYLIYLGQGKKMLKEN